MRYWWLAALIGCAGTRPVTPEVARAPVAERGAPGVVVSAPKPDAAGADEASSDEVSSNEASRAERASANGAAKGDGEAGVEPCAPDTAGHREAAARLDVLRTIVDDLAGTDDPSRANEALAEVLAHPCFEVAAWDKPNDLVADSGLAMKTWWGRGGGMWLDDTLSLADVGSSSRYWVMPNAMPRSLTLDRHPAHPLAFLLCKQGDGACGVETRGWRQRAEAHFELYGEAKHRRHQPYGQDDCRAEAEAAAPDGRFDAWVGCVARLEAPVEALPLGEFRAPTDGWLVLRGRRGHHSFCDEIWAYGLRAGAMYVVKSCSGLALEHGGSVDHRATDAGRSVKTEVARVPIDDLREAALMVLLSTEEERPAHQYARGVAIPEGMKVQRRAYHGLGFGGAWSSGHTTLSWSYVRQGKEIVSGKLQYPDDLNRAAGDHAMRLVRAVEAAQVPGCAPERLGALPLGAKGPPVNALDADPQSLAAGEAALVTELQRLQTRPPLCRGR